MEVSITGRHAELDDELKAHTLNKFQGLDRFRKYVRSVECIFDEGHLQMRVEAIAHLSRGAPIIGHAESGDLRTSVDAAYGKLERVLIRLKEKLETRRHDAPPVIDPLGPVSEELPSFDDVLAELAGEED